MKLPGFLTRVALGLIQDELERLAESAVPRDFEMPGYQTPRKLSVLGGRMIRSLSPLLYSLYYHHALRSTVEHVVGHRIHTCQHEDEFLVANFLERCGDTHGWHIDDPSYALVVFAEAPEPDGGGEVETISNWIDLCRRKRRAPDRDIADLVAWARDNDLIERHHHAPGDAYLLRADQTLHRVVPLARPTERRRVLNFAFQAEPRMAYGSTASHLYGSFQ